MTTPIIPPDNGADPFYHPDAPTGPVPVIAPDAMAPGSSARSRTPILLAVIGAKKGFIKACADFCGSLLAMIRGLALSPGSPSSPCRGSSA